MTLPVNRVANGSVGMRVTRWPSDCNPSAIRYVVRAPRRVLSAGTTGCTATTATIMVVSTVPAVTDVKPMRCPTVTSVAYVRKEVPKPKNANHRAPSKPGGRGRRGDGRWAGRGKGVAGAYDRRRLQPETGAHRGRHCE